MECRETLSRLNFRKISVKITFLVFSAMFLTYRDYFPHKNPSVSCQKDRWVSLISYESWPALTGESLMLSQLIGQAYFRNSP